MPLYSYFTIDSQGNYKRGDWFGPSKVHLYQELKQKNSRLICCRPVKNFPLTDFFRAKVKPDDLIHFCVHLEQMIRVKIPLTEGIMLLLGSPLSRQFKRVLINLYHSLHQGYIFSDAIRVYPLVFDSVFCEFISVAEKTGDLGSAFKKLTVYYQNKKLYRQHLVQSLRYPIILLLAICGLVVLIGFIFLPQFYEHINQTNQSAPAILQMFSSCLQFLEINGLFLTVMSLTFLGVFYILLKKSKKMHYRWHKFFVGIPAIGPLRQRVVINKFLQTLALLLSTQIGLLVSFEKSLGGVNNLFLKKQLQDAYFKLQNGLKLSQSLSTTKMIGQIAQRYIEIGEETGNLASLLQKYTVDEFGQINQSIRELITWVEIVLLVVAGALLMWVVAAILLPLYDGLAILQH